MNWESPAAFFAMGGDGFFVWGSYAVALLCMLVEPWLAARRRRRALGAVRDDSGNPDPSDRLEDEDEDRRT
jgi:heme exporter protein D